MNIKKFQAGVLQIINKKTEKSFYLACANLDKSIAAQTALLQQGKHPNQMLRHDYCVQDGQEFFIKILEKDIHYRAANEIVEIWLESDNSAYNHCEKN